MSCTRARRLRPPQGLLVLGAVAAALAFAAPRAEAGFLSGLLGLFKKKPVSGPLTVAPAAQQELAALMDGFWPRFRPQVEGTLRAAVAQQAGQRHGALLIERLSVRVLDISRAPRITSAPIDDGQTRVLGFVKGKPRYAGELFTLEFPGDAAGWTLALDGRIAYDLDVSLGFTRIKKTIRTDVSLDATKLKATSEVEVDTATDPTLPTFKKFHTPKLDFALKIRTHKLLADALLVVLKPVVHALIAHGLHKTFAGLDPTLATLAGKPGVPFGTGGPAFVPFGQTPDLELAANTASDDCQKDHTPFGTVFGTQFTSPTYHQGTPVDYLDPPDSPLWTGLYLAGEALRFAATKDPIAIPYAKKVIGGLRTDLDVQDPASGRLSRFAIPLTDPYAQQFLPAQGIRWIARYKGQDWVCEENISRDQYTGVVTGLSAAHDFIDDPFVKSECESLLQRIVTFLESSGWNGLRRDGTVVAPFIQAPIQIIAFTAAAERTDPTRFGAIRARHGRIASYAWFGEMMSSLDPLQDYFKWNLESAASWTALRLETDPDRHRSLERAFAVMRRAIGHHRNAWFSGVEAAVDPAARARLAPVIEDDLRRLVSRGRREFSVQNSTDPTIAKAVYTGGLQANGGTVAVGGTGLGVGTPPQVQARYPVPVEKRHPTGFLWEANPFGLDGTGDPTKQGAGVDIVLPYWLGRYYGFLK